SPLGGSTTSSYTVGAATVSNAGGYDVVVNNTYGSVTSSVAQLTVLVPPAITTQPTNQTVAAGANVNFQVSASGTLPLNYQWWFNGTNSVGSNSNVLTLVNAQPNLAGSYCVVVSNSAGFATSVVATLTIGTPPTITQPPASQTVIQGQTATFGLSANGDIP